MSKVLSTETKFTPGLVEDLIELAHQYRDDMRYPPAFDSRARRIEWINSILSDIEKARGGSSNEGE